MKDDIEFAKAGFNQALRGFGTRPPANVEKRKKAEKTAGQFSLPEPAADIAQRIGEKRGSADNKEDDGPDAH